MMRLDQKIPVEPLDAQRVARIERGVLARFDGLGDAPRFGRRTWLHWFAPTVAVAGVAVAVFLNVRAAGTTVPQPMVLAQHEPLVVETGSEASRMVVGRATIHVAPDSKVSVTRTLAGGVSVAVDTGRVDCEVEPRPNRPPFLVHAGAVRVTVVGTIFSVERTDAVRVSVSRGRVRVDDVRGSTRMVAAGESWSGQATLMASAAHTGTPGGATMPGSPSSVRPPAVDIDTRHRAKLKRRQSRIPTVARRSSPKARERVGGPAKAAPPKAVEPWHQLRTARVSLGGLLPITATRARDMVAAYTAISVKGRGSRAAHALYSLAHVQLLRRGDRAAALKTIRFYQRRFARGSHARDVQWLRIRALCGKGGSDTCRSAAHAYLNRFGAAGERGRIASSIIGWGM